MSDELREKLTSIVTAAFDGTGTRSSVEETIEQIDQVYKEAALAGAHRKDIERAKQQMGTSFAYAWVDPFAQQEVMVYSDKSGLWSRLRVKDLQKEWYERFDSNYRDFLRSPEAKVATMISLEVALYSAAKRAAGLTSPTGVSNVASAGRSS